MSSIIKAEYVFYDNSVPLEKLGDNLKSSKEELYDIYNQRETIIKEAKAEALKIINTAKKNAQLLVEECKKNAYEEGYNEGLKNGENKGYELGYKEGFIDIKKQLLEENEIKVKEISDILEIVEKQKQTIISKYENEIGKTSLDIAEKILKQKIYLDDKVISNIILNTLKDYKNAEWIKIYISDKDEVKMIEADKSLVKELKKITNDIKIEAVKELNMGSCIIETPDDIIDTGLDTQLNNLKEILLSK